MSVMSLGGALEQMGLQQQAQMLPQVPPDIPPLPAIGLSAAPAGPTKAAGTEQNPLDQVFSMQHDQQLQLQHFMTYLQQHQQQQQSGASLQSNNSFGGGPPGPPPMLPGGPSSSSGPSANPPLGDGLRDGLGYPLFSGAMYTGEDHSSLPRTTDSGNPRATGNSIDSMSGLRPEKTDSKKRPGGKEPAKESSKDRYSNMDVPFRTPSQIPYQLPAMPHSMARKITTVGAHRITWNVEAKRLKSSDKVLPNRDIRMSWKLKSHRPNRILKRHGFAYH